MFVHCTVFWLNAVDIAVVPAGPACCLCQAELGVLQESKCSLCVEGVPIPPAQSALQGIKEFCACLQQRNLMYSRFLKTSSGFKLAN